MGNTLKQRLVHVDTNEVSVVDDPANEQEWLVVKNKQGVPVTTVKKNAEAATTTTTPDAAAFDAAIATGMEAQDAVTKATATGDPAAISAAAELVVEAAKSLKAIAKSMPPWMKKDGEEEEKKKSTDGVALADPNVAISVGMDGGVTFSPQIAKSINGVGLSAAEVDAAVITTKNLMGMVAKSNPGAFQNAVADLQKMDLSIKPGFSSAIRPQGEGAVPTMTVETQKNVNGVDEISVLKARIAKLEGEPRGPAQSGGDGAPAAPVQKSKGLFSGIL